jgi:hypothetical protein
MAPKMMNIFCHSSFIFMGSSSSSSRTQLIKDTLQKESCVEFRIPRCLLQWRLPISKSPSSSSSALEKWSHLMYVSFRQSPFILLAKQSQDRRRENIARYHRSIERLRFERSILIAEIVRQMEHKDTGSVKSDSPPPTVRLVS